jgi:transcriptional regulator with XRE-family HTH domain
VGEPPTPPVAASLARRLRELRQSRKLTQGEVAHALFPDERVAISTLSAWENVRTPTLPPRNRLSAYAQFFATGQSLEGIPHLVPLEELSPEEHEARNELERELFRLRDADAGEVSSPRQSWRFEDGAPITIICSDLAESDIQLGPLSDMDNPNYTELFAYADLDALMALYGHLSSRNPDAEIRFRRASQATADDLTSHLVLLGGIAWNDVTRRLNDSVGLPVRQVRDEKISSGEIFEIVGGRNHEERYTPRWLDDDPGTSEKPGILLEDVGMLARLPNPFNVHRTLTYCSGIHSRGVLGAVRCLTDVTVRDTNECYLEETFLGSDRFIILMRVPVVGSRTISPSLSNPQAVLFHWPGDSRGI